MVPNSVTVVSCIRLALLITWFDQFYKGLGSKDIYYSYGWAASPIECNLAIIAACLPALWPLIRKTWPGLYTTDPSYSYRVNTQPGGASHHASAFRSNLSRPMGASRLDDDTDDAFMMKTMQANGQVDCRATTPTGSQDGIMDFNKGIVRTTDVEVGYEDATKERDFANDRDEYGRKVAYAV